jgi:hypothetical protein
MAPGRFALHAPAEAGGKLIGRLSESMLDHAGLVLGHEGNRRESGSFVQVRNIG